MNRNWLRRARSRQCLALASAVLLAVLAAGCVTNTDLNPQTAFNPRSDYANEGLNLFIGVIISGVVVGVLVEAALIVTAIRYRRRAGDALPPQIHGSTVIEVIWTTAPVIIVGAILFYTLPVIFSTQAPAPTGSMNINVTGHQFWWEFTYPDSGVVTANELHLPLGQTVNLVLESNDVIHSFWVPALGGKRDAFPGHTNYIWLKPDTVGEYPGQCYQLCGYSHGNMREKAIVESPQDFQTWVTAQQAPAAAPTDTTAAEGGQLFQTRGCAACHTIRGTPADGKVGPNLTHLATSGVIAGAILQNTPTDLREWLKDPPAVKPGSIMPNLGLNDHELDVLVAYLQSLK